MPDLSHITSIFRSSTCKDLSPGSYTGDQEVKSGEPDFTQCCAQHVKCSTCMHNSVLTPFIGLCRRRRSPRKATRTKVPPMWMRGRWRIPLQRSYGSRGEPSPSLMLESAAGASLRQEDLTRIGLCLLVFLLPGVRHALCSSMGPVLSCQRAAPCAYSAGRVTGASC